MFDFVRNRGGGTIRCTKASSGAVAMIVMEMRMMRMRGHPLRSTKL